jgi:hypothetical protein
VLLTLFDLTNRVTTSFTPVGSCANSFAIDSVATRTHTRGGALLVHRPHLLEGDPVWLKYYVASSCLSMIIAEQATEACPPHHVTCLATDVPLPRNQLVIETLMIALGMIMGHKLMDHV